MLVFSQRGSFVSDTTMSNFDVAQCSQSSSPLKYDVADTLQYTIPSHIILNSNTPCLYTPMVKCSDILSDKSLGGLV